MTTWLKSILTGILAAAICFAMLLLTGKNNSNIYDAVYRLQFTSENKDFSVRDLKQRLEHRLDRKGLLFEIKNYDSNTLQVSLRNIQDTTEASRDITFTGRLQFREAYMLTDSGMSNFLVAANNLLLDKVPAKQTSLPKKKDSMSKAVSDLLDSMDQSPPVDESPSGLTDYIRFGTTSFIGAVKEKDTALVRNIFADPALRSDIPTDLVLVYGPDDSKMNKKSKEQLFLLYAVKNGNAPGKAIIENEDLEDAIADFNQDGHPVVTITFTNAGKNKWAYLTQQNIRRPIAIIFNDMVITAPLVESVMNTKQITLDGNFTVTETKNMAALFRSSAIPGKLSIIHSVIKKQSDHRKRRNLLFAGIAFLLFTGLGYFILKSLKAS